MHRKIKEVSHYFVIYNGNIKIQYKLEWDSCCFVGYMYGKKIYGSVRVKPYWQGKRRALVNYECQCVLSFWSSNGDNSKWCRDIPCLFVYLFGFCINWEPPFSDSCSHHVATCLHVFKEISLSLSPSLVWVGSFPVCLYIIKFE